MARTRDLSPRSYAQWLRLVFDHPVPDAPDDPRQQGSPNEWYWEDGVEFRISSPARLVAHTTRLCREFKTVADSYTLEQINQGIWFLLGPAIDQFGEYLADVEVPLESRVACVRAMLHPYADFVAPSKVEMMEGCFDMWWDMLCGGFWSAHRSRLKAEEINALMEQELQTDEDHERFLEVASFWANASLHEDLDEQLKTHGLTREEATPLGQGIEVSYDDLEDDEKLVADAMLETLGEILALNDDRCQGYALHGLGHLHHPQVRPLVQAFIDEHRDEWDEDGLRWVEACRDGTVM